MNLQEALNAQPTRNNVCKFNLWYNALTETDRQTITASFNNTTIETTHIIRTLQAYGCPSSDSTIRTHRRQECKTCR